MRGKIFDRLFERMAEDPDVFFLTADMGINLVERIRDAYPDRYANVGIAEQNLIGVSAGLCNAGYRPFAYTISNFLIHRCFEQIRDDVAIHGYPVVLLGTTSGFDNAPLGPTHHAIDDWGALRTIPNIDIYAPSCAEYATGVVDRLLDEGRPAFVRIAKGAPSLPAPAADTMLFPAARPETLLVSYGSMVQECMAVREARDDVSVLAVNRLRPLDEDAVLDAVAGHDRIIVVEDHFPHTGLYGVLCQLWVERGVATRIESRAPALDYTLAVGASSDYFHRKFGMDSASIAASLA